MNWVVRTAGVLALLVAFSPTMDAQWPKYPTPGVPRAADGKPILDGPAPRTADGKVDFSGVWQRPFGVTSGTGRGQGAAPAVPATTPDGIPISTFGEVAGRGYPLPMTPWAAELKKRRMADNMKDNPDAHCLPMGLMQFHNHGQPRKMVQTPGLIVITYEANYGLRYIFMDGRKLPGSDAQPWWYGYSVGRWEGDTLVVDSTGFRDGEWLDIIGNPMTDAAKVTERFRRPTFGTLEIDVTIDDPKAYTKPWTVRVNQRLLADTDLIEFVCNENELFQPWLKKQQP